MRQIAMCKITMREILITVTVVAALGIGLALVSGCGSQGSTSGGTPSSQPSSAVVVSGSTGVSATDSLVTDPAKEEPVLDKFTSKDPFFDNNIGTASTTGDSASSTGSSSTLSVTPAHSMKLKQINTANGISTATFVVDGVTYSNEVIGKTFSTSWGQIVVLSIDTKAQTVTLLHGDSTVTMKKGQTSTSG